MSASTGFRSFLPSFEPRARATAPGSFAAGPARPASGSSQQHATAPPYSPPEHAACSFAAMRLVLFRSAWGLNLRADAARACASVRAAGFDGIEASLTDIGGSQAERLAFGKAAQAEGLELILSAYSSWVNYEGVCEARPVWVEELQPQA